MPIVNTPMILSLGFESPALRVITLSCTRNGQQTTAYKEGVLWDSIYTRKPLLYLPLRNGISKTQTVVAAAIDGLKAIMLYDFEAQPYAAVRTPSITADIVLNIDLNDGSGGVGSEPTEPATALARVRVERQPAGREIVAIERKTDGIWRYAGFTRIDDTGQLDMQVTGGDVYVVAADDYGFPFQSNLTIDVGATVRPSRYAGWLYRCTEAGQLPADEPDWWPELGDNPPRQVGTARLQAVRYYQPIAHGPIKYELV